MERLRACDGSSVQGRKRSAVSVALTARELPTA